jgi:hypothetical protein
MDRSGVFDASFPGCGSRLQAESAAHRDGWFGGIPLRQCVGFIEQVVGVVVGEGADAGDGVMAVCCRTHHSVEIIEPTLSLAWRSEGAFVFIRN